MIFWVLQMGACLRLAAAKMISKRQKVYERLRRADKQSREGCRTFEKALVESPRGFARRRGIAGKFLKERVKLHAGYLLCNYEYNCPLHTDMYRTEELLNSESGVVRSSSETGRCPQWACVEPITKITNYSILKAGVLGTKIRITYQEDSTVVHTYIHIIDY